jgi:hypothetical protein
VIEYYQSDGIPRPRRPVFDLQGDPDRPAGCPGGPAYTDGVNALCPLFPDPTPGADTEEVRREPALAGDHPGARGHGPDRPLPRPRRQPGLSLEPDGQEPRVSPRQAGKGKEEDRQIAPIDPNGNLRDRNSGQIRDPPQNLLLDRMRGLLVVSSREAVEPASQQQTGVLAGAVVVECARPLPPASERASGRLVHRPVGPADQVAHRKPAPLEQPLGHTNVAPLSPVRGADESDLVVAKMERAFPAGLEQGQDLEGLARRTDEDAVPGVTELEDWVSVGVHDRCETTMHRLEPPPAQHTGDGGRGRRYRLSTLSDLWFHSFGCRREVARV